MNPLIPIHVTDIPIGMEVKVTFKVSPHKGFSGDPCRHHDDYLKGSVKTNDPTTGKMSITSADSSGNSKVVSINYSCINSLYRIVSLHRIVDSINASSFRLIPVKF